MKHSKPWLMLWGILCKSINTSIPVSSNKPDSKVHGANMGPIWGRQVPGGPHDGPMNFAFWEYYVSA